MWKKTQIAFLIACNFANRSKCFQCGQSVVLITGWKSCGRQAQLRGVQAAGDVAVLVRRKRWDSWKIYLQSRGQSADPLDCPWDITEEGACRSSVSRIICQDLRLKCFKRRRAQELETRTAPAAHMKHAKLLLQNFRQSATDFIFFTVIGRFTWQPAERPHCHWGRWALAALSSDVQQVDSGRRK